MARETRFDDHKIVVLKRIAAAEKAHGQRPSIRELAAHVGVGVATMHSYLIRLAEEGMIEWQPKHHRSLRCTRKGMRAVG